MDPSKVFAKNRHLPPDQKIRLKEKNVPWRISQYLFVLFTFNAKPDNFVRLPKAKGAATAGFYSVKNWLHQ